MDAYLERLAEAERRDHRKLGIELDLFSFPDELGSGLAVFHPKGGILRRELEDYVRQRHIDEGFDFVNTPHISKDGLFHTSGHLPYYADGMFPPMEMEGSKYYLKAMNCPMHNLIFRSRGRSYRELPLRFFEFGSVYRNELSGVVHGLTRVRGMTQDDSHSYCTPEQAPDEIAKLLRFVLGLLSDFGLDDFYLELSTRDPLSDKFIGSRRGVGGGHRRAGSGWPPSPGSSWSPTRAARPTTGRRSPIQCRRRHRPHLADVDHPVRLQPAGEVRPGIQRGRRHPAAAGDDPLGQVRFHRAVHRRAHRALRRGVPGLAGAGAGGRHPGRRRVRRSSRGRATGSCAAAGSGPRSTTPTTGCRRRSAPTPPARCRSCCWPARRTSRRGAVSFRFRDGTQVNGVPVAEAVDAIDGWVRSRSNASPTAEAVQRPGAAGRAPTRAPRAPVGIGGWLTARTWCTQDGIGVPDHLQRLWTPHRMAYVTGGPAPSRPRPTAPTGVARSAGSRRCPTRTG